MKPRLNDWAWHDGRDWISLENFRPEDPGDFFIKGRMYIGNYEKPGEDTFELTVCSPKWFFENEEKEFSEAEFEFKSRGVSSKGIMLGRHYLFMKVYDYKNLNDFLRKYLEENCEGVTWEDVAAKIGRLAYWEFEDTDINGGLPSI